MIISKQRHKIKYSQMKGYICEFKPSDMAIEDRLNFLVIKQI